MCAFEDCIWWHWVIFVIGGFLITLGDCHHLDGLVDCGLHCEAHVVIVRCSREELVRGVVLAPWEPRRATLVERDAKGDKWSDRIKVLELVVSTSRGRV